MDKVKIRDRKTTTINDDVQIVLVEEWRVVGYSFKYKGITGTVTWDLEADEVTIEYDHPEVSSAKVRTFIKKQLADTFRRKLDVMNALIKKEV